MSVSIDGFLKHLNNSGIFSNDEIATLEIQIPAEKRTKNAESLARQLVRLKKLTEFQADTLCREHPQALILGNYVLQDIIGSGGMGVVYKAQHRRMKRIVAIKVLSAASLQSAKVVQRFLREAEAVAKLSHPNIVAAFDADEHNGVPFLAMEYVQGIDLAMKVDRDGPLDIKTALDCIMQAAKGLEHAHFQGIIHRDVKPGNLLVDNQGVVKILDMGLARINDERSSADTKDARLAADTAEAASITQMGSVVGTVDFMSPEQAVDSSMVDQLSDIYSLGATFYFLMTGKPMYEAKTLMARLVAHRDAPIPSICAVRADAPAQLDSIFCRLVAKKKEDRYPSMSEVIYDLSNWKAASADGRAPSGEVIVPKSVIDMIFDQD